jgi:hypothetical protein
MNELPLFARARASDPETSHAAAASIDRNTETHRKLLEAWRCAGARGLTDEEAAIAADLPPLVGYWKRCSELRAAGRIVPTGETRVGSTGRRRIVCRIA